MSVDTVDLFNRADAEWERGRKKKAFSLFLRAALLGEAAAQHNVGYFYHVGIGVKRNKKRALFWYKKAWRNDRETGTCINIAKVYESQKKHRVALAWWQKAISKGDGEAALELAKVYLKRQNKRDHAKARALLRKARKSTDITESGAEEVSEILRSQKWD